LASGDKEKPLPGIDQGSIYHEGTAFVVWSDFDVGGGGSSSVGTHGAKGQGRLSSRDKHQVDFHFETRDGKTGPVLINRARYDLADGGLFLVSAEGDQIRVKQLQRDMRGLKFERESLGAFARGDADIVAFFARKAGKE
jgi:hypothetical protein